MIMDNTLSLAQAVPLQPQQQLQNEKLQKLPGQETELDPKAFEAQLSQLAAALAVAQPQPEAVKQSVAEVLSPKSDMPVAGTSPQAYTPAMAQMQQMVPSTKADSVIAGPQTFKALEQSLSKPGISTDMSARPQVSTEVKDTQIPSQSTPKTHKQLSQVQSAPQLEAQMAQIASRMGGEQSILTQAVSSPIAGAQTKAMQPIKRDALESEDLVIDEMGLAAPTKGAESAPLMISGGEFLSALQSARKPSATDRSPAAAAVDRPDGASILAKPQLKVIPGKGAEASTLPLADKPRELLKLVSKEGEPLFRDQLTASSVIAAPAQFMARSEQMAPPVEVTGHVVQGAMTRERLSSESLAQIVTGIGSLGNLQQGGEMKIRLKPDNLGELHLRVSTSGNQVGLKIQASDDGAKKVLEESIQYLKDSLSSRNLSLSRVEFTVAQPVTSLAQQGGTSLADYSSQSQQYQGLRGDFMNDGSGYEQPRRQGGQSEAELEYAPEFSRGRLDVRA